MKKLGIFLVTAAAISLQSCTSDPVAAFSSDATLVTPGQVVTFTDNSTDAYNHVWDFGDGEWSNAINPTHVYYDQGSYEVTLQVSDKKGGTTVFATPSTITVDGLAEDLQEAEQQVKDDVIAVMVGFWDVTDYTINTSNGSSTVELGSSAGDFMANGDILQQNYDGNLSTGYYYPINSEYVYLSFIQGPSGVYEIDGGYEDIDDRMTLIYRYKETSFGYSETHTLEFRK